VRFGWHASVGACVHACVCECVCVCVCVCVCACATEGCTRASHENSKNLTFSDPELSAQGSCTGAADAAGQVNDEDTHVVHTCLHLTGFGGLGAAGGGFGALGAASGVCSCVCVQLNVCMC
jgi:hypothetical protein